MSSQGKFSPRQHYSWSYLSVLLVLLGASTASAQVAFFLSTSGARPIRAEGLTEATGTVAFSAQSSGTIKVGSTLRLDYGTAILDGSGTVATSCVFGAGGSLTRTYSGNVLTLTVTTADLRCSAGQSISVSSVRVDANAAGAGNNVTVFVSSSVPPGFQATNPISLIQFTSLTVATVQSARSGGLPSTPKSINPSAPAIPTPPGEPATVAGNPDPSPTAANSLRVNLRENFGQEFLSAASEAAFGGGVLNGTRFRVQLTGIPTGISVYAPRAVTSFSAGTAATTGSVDPNVFDAIALIRVGTVDNPVNADGSGGALNPVVLNQFDRIPVVGGTATIIYEVTTDSTTQVETITFFVALTGAAPTGTGIISGSVGFAPVGPTTIAPALPRFVAAPTQLVALVGITNHPPVANAGADQIVNENGGCIGEVLLDGTNSSDPDGDALTYIWTGPFGTRSGPRLDPLLGLGVLLGLGTHTITLTVSDGLGGFASDTVVITVLDRRAPTTTALQPAPNAAGWYRNEITVTLIATDRCSGVKEISYSLTGAQTGAAVVTGDNTTVTISVEGITTLTYFARDNAVNQEAPKSLQIQIDKTTPTISASAKTADNNPYTAGTWTNQNVTVHFTCSDSLSGLAPGSPPLDTTVSSEGSNLSVSGTCTDLAGNSASATFNPIKIDRSPPTISVTARTADNRPYTAGTWTNQNVTVHFTCFDSGSGLAPGSPPADTIVSAEGSSPSVSGTCTDVTEKSASATFGPINIDRTAPTITGSRSPAANPNGWNNTDVTVSFACSDALSGLAAGNPPPNTILGEGANQSVTRSCTDNVGNSATATVSGINIDKTPPSLACRITPERLWRPNHQMVPVNALVNVVDLLSGPTGFALLSATSNEPDQGLGDGDSLNDIQGFVIGTADTSGLLRAERAGMGRGRLYTLTYRATDAAGNSAICAPAVSVPRDMRP
ncbi:MAG: hypothetical protein A3H28_07235 [Acidobacteria bacterium RIFCSPLOWO2_02_FULL_61_28]|nr:MAG: hypothetical protein A3H28_07235 [Acidobacteria bacterium RIFCSPLOWO2_02_FULL_61_28]